MSRLLSHRFSPGLRLVSVAVAATALATTYQNRRRVLLESPEEGNSATRTIRKQSTEFWTKLSYDLPRQLCAFIDASPSPHYVVDNAKALLESKGFTELREDEQWDLRPGGKYFVNRNGDSGTSLAAFAVGEKWQPGGPFSIIGTHVDSPCLRIKPTNKRAALGYQQLAVELYGGGLWHTWYDRDLGLAGRVLVRTGPYTVESRLVNIHEPVARVASLAAHYRKHNPLSIDLERHLIPLIGSEEGETAWNRELNADNETEEGKARLDEDRKARYPDGRSTRYFPAPALNYSHESLVSKICEQAGVRPGAVLDLDLCLYDTQPADIGGIHNEYVFAARLDNLMMTYCGLVAFTRSLNQPDALNDDKSVRVLAMFDHEEIGSNGPGAAKSTFIPHVLKRVCAETTTTVKAGIKAAPEASSDKTAFERSMARSFFLSADMVHAVHPAHSQFHDSQHRVYPNDGLVISSSSRNSFMHNTPGRYIMREVACRSIDLLRALEHESKFGSSLTTSDTTSESDEPTKIQVFVNPNDVSCGSTLGSLFGTMSGIRVVDVGNAQLSMHSAREMAGAADVANAVAILQGFYRDFVTVDEQTDVR